MTVFKRSHGPTHMHLKSTAMMMTCDICGTQYASAVDNQNDLRIAAAKDGWHSIYYQNMIVADKNSKYGKRSVARMTDYCPECPMFSEAEIIQLLQASDADA